jgi:hypothetical protein
MIRISKEILQKEKPNVISPEGLKNNYFEIFGYSFNEVFSYEELNCFFKYDGDLNSYFKLWILVCYRITGKKESTIEESITETFVYYKSFNLKNDSGVLISRNGFPYDNGSIKRPDDPELTLIYNKPNLKFRKMKLIGHYTKMEKVLEHILPDNRLLINNFKDSNDPWEYRENCYTIFDISKIWPDPIDQYIIEPQMQAEFFNRVRSISFTQDTSLVRSFDHPGMWAHYGQNHKGICLVFDLNEFKKLFKTQFKRNAKFGSLKYGKLESKTIRLENDITLEKVFKEYAKELFYKKLRDWKNEEEYRFTTFNSSENCNVNTYLKDINNALVAIILGAHFNKTYKCVIENHLLNRNHKNKIELYHLVFSNGHFYIKDSNSNEETQLCKDVLNGYIIDEY